MPCVLVREEDAKKLEPSAATGTVSKMAFASQAIACMRELKMDEAKTNPLGSGISLGHPIGCTGARLLVTIAHEMKRKNQKHGLITMCIGGGQGMAMIIER